MKHAKRHPLIFGTIILTATGLITRVIGFFYRIYLSRLFGEEGMGIYQLLSPALSLSFSLTAAGYQTAISKYVAADSAKRPSGNLKPLLAGISITLPLSLVTNAILFFSADPIGIFLLKDHRTVPMLRILSFSVPFAALHACINGYYYGKKNAFVPSLCQLIEQIARVGSVWIIFQVTTEKGIPLNAFHAVCGLVIGECFGLLVSMSALLQEKRLPRGSYSTDSVCNRTMTHAFLAMVLPLTINRLAVAFSTSLENLLIPQKLQLYGYSQAEALSVYGILSGMTLSIILFPCVLTNSLSVLLLPAISEAKGRANENQIRRTTKKAIRLGLLLGFAFTILFLFTGDMIGNKLFHNALAGRFICRLAWLCPLMYVSSLLSSILHGLGRPKQVLFVNLLACLIRIGMIWFLVPGYGIGAYLWGLLLSQVFASVACMWLLREYM